MTDLLAALPLEVIVIVLPCAVILGLVVIIFESQLSCFISAGEQAILVLASAFTVKIPFANVAAPNIELQPALIEIPLSLKEIVINSFEARFRFLPPTVIAVDLKVKASTSEKFANLDLEVAAFAEDNVLNDNELTEVTNKFVLTGRAIGKRIGTIAKSAIAINLLLPIVFILFCLCLFW